MRVGLIGGGVIARLFLEEARRGAVRDAEVVAVMGRSDASRGKALAPRLVVDSSAGDADGNNVVAEDELSALTRVEMVFETVARALAMKAAWMRAAVTSR